MKRAAAASTGVLTGAQKWLTGALTMLAAFMALLVNAKSLGLSPWLGLVSPNIADHAAQRIVLLPRSDTLRAIGEPAVITATVTDARGAALAGATLRWKTTDSTVAAVDSTGMIVARGPGRATIEVSVREISATATVLVRPTPSHLVISGDSSIRVADGDTLRFTTTILDARGHPVEGLSPHWHATEGQVVHVDSTGALRALAPGRATVTAAIGELSANVRVEVVLTPASVVVLSGEGQRALTGRTLPAPVVLQVLTRAGQPVPGATLLLTAEEGEGVLSPDTATTDSQGRARITWKLGASAGEQHLFARVPTLDSVLTVRAEADPVPANTKVEVMSPETTGMVHRELGAPIVLHLSDTLGAALAYVRVAWTALDGGSVSGESRTDSAGNAQAHWTLGTRTGSQRLTVQVGNPRFMPATTVKATAAAGPATSLTLVSGDAQRAVVATALLKPVVVALRDSLGNAVAGAMVIGKPSAGTLTDTTAQTDSLGRATLKWTMGAKPGAQKLEVIVVGARPRVVATATSRVGPPALVAMTARANGAGGALRVLATVTDAAGNGVPGTTLAFTASSGRVSLASVKADTAGRAQVVWTPSATAKVETTISSRVVGTKIAGTHVVAAPAAARVASKAPKTRN